MKRFIFSLQSVLELKIKLENQEKALFQTASEKLRKEQERLKELERRRFSYEELLRECINTKLNLLTIRERKTAIETLKEMIQQQIGNVRKAERHMEVARKRLEEAMKERKTLEKLRENAFVEYKKEYDKEEQKEIDELVSFRHKQNM